MPGVEEKVRADGFGDSSSLRKRDQGIKTLTPAQGRTSYSSLGCSEPRYGLPAPLVPRFALLAVEGHARIAIESLKSGPPYLLIKQIALKTFLQRS
jgi:hypothetical protein